MCNNQKARRNFDNRTLHISTSPFHLKGYMPDYRNEIWKNYEIRAIHEKGPTTSEVAPPFDKTAILPGVTPVSTMCTSTGEEGTAASRKRTASRGSTNETGEEERTTKITNALNKRLMTT